MYKMFSWIFIFRHNATVLSHFRCRSPLALELNWLQRAKSIHLPHSGEKIVRTGRLCTPPILQHFANMSIHEISPKLHLHFNIIFLFHCIQAMWLWGLFVRTGMSEKLPVLGRGAFLTNFIRWLVLAMQIIIIIWLEFTIEYLSSLPSWPCMHNTLSERIGPIGCPHNSPSGSMLIEQLTKLQLLTRSRTVDSADFQVQWTESAALILWTQVISSPETIAFIVK